MLNARVLIFKQADVRKASRVHFSFLIYVFSFLLSIFSGRAQTNLNIADYGAAGNAVGFFVNTVSNSTEVTVTGTNTFSSSDIGKIIEVFGAGPWVYYGGSAVVTQQDIICQITGVPDATHLSLSIPCGWTMNAYCIVGANDAPAIQAAINDASSIVASGQYTNVTINIPAGTYLLASSNILNPGYAMTSISDTHSELTISSGGITFAGDPSGNSILMSCGAGMEHYVNASLSWIASSYAPYVPMRDTLLVCQGPVAYSQYPLVFENVTFDGGVQQGAQPYNYWEIIQVNGMGWDTTHHAVADNAGPYNTPNYLQMNQYKQFTNCVFQHWRGEICICWTSCATNCLTAWDNCTFWDGNATADNMYYGQRINHCTFNNVGKVMEYYQDNGYTNSSIMENCIVTNISEVAGPGNLHVDCAITGATTNRTMPSFIFSNNQFYDNVGMEFFSLNAAENVSFISNSFSSAGPAINLTGIGQQPSDGTQVWYMTNILVVGNQFACASPLSIGFSEVEDLLCSNNTGFSVTASIGYATNIVLSGNTGYDMGNDYYNVMSGPIQPGNSSKIASGHYMTDLPNNNWVVSTPYTIDGGSPYPTNLISYGNGRIHKLQASGSTFYLEDTKPKLIPVGAVLQVYASTWGGQNVTNFYTSEKSPSGHRITITNNAPPEIFYWNGSHWEHNTTVKFTTSATIACPLLNIQFKSPKVDSGGYAITSWSWDFGDGSTSTEENPSHVYTSIGLFHPVLHTVDKIGLLPGSSGPAINVINPTLQFTANKTNGISRFTVEFKSPKEDTAKVAIKSWLWNFGDGSTSTKQDPSHTYTNPGSYFPALTVSNAAGLSPLAAGPGILVNYPTLKCTANPTSGSAPLTIEFKSQAKDSGENKIISWYWNFGDGSTSTNQNPSHTYLYGGTFNVSLNAVNAFNLSYSSPGPIITVSGQNNSSVQLKSSEVVTSSPMLTLNPSGDNMILTWPTNATSYTLQFSTDLSPGSWINVTSPPAIIDGQNVVTNSMVGSQMFFRLTQ